ncbi:MAG: glycosyltransferase family 9 protein [candidate division KSB1 bacterium]
MSTTQRFLLSRTDRLGDLVLSTPVATALKKEFPQCEVFFLARDYAAEILDLHPHVDGVLRVDSLGEALRAKALAKLLRSYDFDAVLALYPRPELAWAFYRAAIPLRLGTGYRWFSALFNQRVYEHRKDARRHEAEYNLQLLRPLGIINSRVEFHYRFDALHEQALAEKMAQWNLREPYVVLHPGSGNSARDWPLEHFAALAAHLSRERKLQVVLTGSAQEKALTEFIQTQTAGRAIDLAGRLSLTELAGVLRHAALFAGNSSGPLHVARMMAVPVLAFYPPITACRPERWGPYGCRQDVLMSREEECRRCRNSNECACMREITVAAAIAKAEEKLR